MGTFLLSVIFAAAINISPAPAKADTTNLFIIDGKVREHVGGLTILGAVKEHKISVTEINGEPVKVHVVTTGDTNVILYVVDDIPTTKEYVQSVDPMTIESIKVLKGETAQKEYGDNVSGAVIIRTKGKNKAAIPPPPASFSKDSIKIKIEEK